jgi:predicted nucleotidyltransferase
MQSIDKKHMTTDLGKILQPIFQKYPELVFAYLFGSFADGSAGATSDIDLAVYVNDPLGFPFSRKLQLHGDCCRALKRNDVDLVVLNQSRNLLLIEEILRNGQIILNRNQSVQDAFFLKKLHTAIDFRNQRKKVIGV